MYEAKGNDHGFTSAAGEVRYASPDLGSVTARATFQNMAIVEEAIQHGVLGRGIAKTACPSVQRNEWISPEYWHADDVE